MAYETEWEFTADVASWMNSIIEKNDKLPFSAVKCEQRGNGSTKRRDLTVRDKKGNVVLTGEVKLPDRKDGGSPYNSALVRDARAKAKLAKSRFFFTWNVNELVLWDLESGKPDILENSYRSWRFTSIVSSTQLDHPSILLAIQTALVQFLTEFGSISRGEVAIGHKPPDERFIEVLESSLDIPIQLNVGELATAYNKVRQKAEIDRWMRDEQGWTIASDSAGIQDNLERASKFACYNLVNRLVFYEALLKRYGASLSKLSVPKHIASGDDLRLHLEGYFADARRVTRDYETVFGENHRSIGSRIPFYADGAVPHWRGLIAQIHEFDFSRLDYEVIGAIFERLISPEERQKYGQYYTRVEVVDLMQSFCIRRGDESVMDPACGGGTFLVRAYARKRELMPNRRHGQILYDLFGIDISPFATHLTTINLATRDLVDDENYPQVARHDFFEVQARRAFVTLPQRMKAKGLGALQHREVVVPPLDVVIGNPPYIRQEDIPRAPNKAVPRLGSKDYLLQLVQKEQGVSLSGRSDIHCYFWPHATTFLKDDGYLCLLTSSQWLDVEYGFKLQKWLLQHFEIIAVLESLAEPWFVGARVATTATILRRQVDGNSRAGNIVRFVQLRQPLRAILAHDHTTAGAVAAVDAFRDEILGLSEDTVRQNYRARLVAQGELWYEGTRLGTANNSTDGEDGEESTLYSGDAEEQPRLAEEGSGQGAETYYGSKWGIHLRAPDLWFEFLERFGAKLRPLGEIADVRFGVKTGDDSFFFPKDVSSEALEEEETDSGFEERFGATRGSVVAGIVRIVACGKNLQERRPLEAKYLEPEIHSLMEIEAYAASASDCGRDILLVSGTKNSHRGEHVFDYITWGERIHVNRKPTVAARDTHARGWFDLTPNERATIVLPKIQQYRLISFLNPEGLYQNSSLLGIHAPRREARLLCAVLNSSLAVLARLLYARVLGNEGTIQLDVYSAKMMVIPDINLFSRNAATRRLLTAFEKMLKRRALSFVSDRRRAELTFVAEGRSGELAELPDATEVDMLDRRELDDALFELLGVESKRGRASLSADLYRFLQEHFEAARVKEEEGIKNRNATRRLGSLRPIDLAREIFEKVGTDHPYMLRKADFFLDKEQPFITIDVPQEADAQAYSGFFQPHGIEFKQGRRSTQILELSNEGQVVLALALIAGGERGLLRLPVSETDALSMARRYVVHAKTVDAKLREMVEDRTADPDIQSAVINMVRRAIQGHMP